MNLAHSAMKKLIAACYCMLAMQHIVVITLLIWTVDTDVVVLAVSVTHSLGSECELWLAFGTGKYFCYLLAHIITNALGLEKSRALSMFHALTGCDTGSALLVKRQHGIHGMCCQNTLMFYCNYLVHHVTFQEM